MYQRFYNLQELPFELTPDPKYLYLSRQHREALSNLEYGFMSAKGITALIGEAGTGKTTLLNAALESSRCRNVNCVFINNPTLTRTEFVEVLSERFRLGPGSARSKATLLAELEGVLRAARSDGRLIALAIDEAQSLSGELLEEIRLLANIETPTQKLLPLVLVGQPELRDRLNESNLRQLKQRVTLRCEITPLSLSETADYITSRVRTAGGDATKLFTRDAVTLIYERSRGIPRTISVLCDNALLTGFGLQQQPVSRDIVLEVARDFDLAGVASHPQPSAADADASSGSDRAAGRTAARGVTPTHAAEPPERGLEEPFTARRRLGAVSPFVDISTPEQAPVTRIATLSAEPEGRTRASEGADRGWRSWTNALSRSANPLRGRSDESS